MPDHDEKSSESSHVSISFYVIQGTSEHGRETFTSLPTTAGPWGNESRHGSPPAALMTRAIERLDTGADRVLGRLTVELLGPVPVGPLSVEASVVPPGRSVELCAATLYDEEQGLVARTAQALLTLRR